MDPGDTGNTTSPFVGTVRYMAPELLNPSGFGLKNSNTTKKSDMYAFGVAAYQVRIACFIPGVATEGGIQVFTGQQPFSGAKDGVIIYNIVTGERPDRPLGPNEWISDEVWSLISRCWSPSWASRPNINFAVNALSDAADAAEVRRRKSHATTNGQGKRSSHRVPAALWRFTKSRGRQSRTTDTLPQRSDSTSEQVEEQPHVPQNSQLIQDPPKQPSQIPTLPETSAGQLEPWEVDLVTFLHTCEIGIDIELEGKKAQEFADKLDVVCHSGKRIHLAV